MKRAYKLHIDISHWITHETQQRNGKFKKLEKLNVSNSEWRQIDFIIKLLEPFKTWIKSLDKTQGLIIYKAFVVYNLLFNHLESLRTQKRPDLNFAIKAAIEKLSKYYSKTIGKDRIIYNISAVINLI